jgi:hypothetical protein
MGIYLINSIIILLILASQVFAFGKCPIQSVVGEIQNINGPVEEVKLFRDGERINVQNGQCLVYGDRIEASSNVTVRIASNDTNLLVGKYQRSLSWSAPNKQSDSNFAFLTRAGNVLTELFNKNIDSSAYGTGRGGTELCSDLKPLMTQPIKPLVELPSISQKLGADLASIVVAWKAGSGSGDVLVVLSHSNGGVIAEKHVCKIAHSLIKIPQGTIHTGDSLILEAQDANGTKLRWNITVVMAEQMPKPKESINTDWVLGIWRLIETGGEYKLDSISRLSSGVEESFASRKFQEAVFANEEFNLQR